MIRPIASQASASRAARTAAPTAQRPISAGTIGTGTAAAECAGARSSRSRLDAHRTPVTWLGGRRRRDRRRRRPHRAAGMTGTVSTGGASVNTPTPATPTIAARQRATRQRGLRPASARCPNQARASTAVQRTTSSSIGQFVRDRPCAHRLTPLLVLPRRSRWAPLPIGHPLQLEQIGLAQLLRLDQVHHERRHRAPAIRVDQLAEHRPERRSRPRDRLVVIRLAHPPPGDVPLLDQRRQVRPQRGVLDRLREPLLDLGRLQLAVLPEQAHDLQLPRRESRHGAPPLPV